eukprot:gb/GECG01010250.1/.p1 GENE.gb/GECG01010250.1/~~gb/GECG01010250.1/.p1  ORF type:complete len:283 (+),score=46.14 gb/GECG01010250.1/:1-849(+)
MLGRACNSGQNAMKWALQRPLLQGSRGLYSSITTVSRHIRVSPVANTFVTYSSSASMRQEQKSEHAHREILDEMIKEYRQKTAQSSSPSHTAPPEGVDELEAGLFERIQEARNAQETMRPWEAAEEEETKEDLDEYVQSDEYVPEQDPLYDTMSFNVNQVRIATQEMLNGTLGDSPNNRKVTLEAYIANLGLDPVVEKYAKVIAGKRYLWDQQKLYLVSRKYRTAHENKRHLLELLEGIITEAKRLANELGDFHLPHPQPKRYGYRQARMKKKRKAKKGLPF